MSSKTKTAQLIARIAEIETDIAQQVAEREKMKADLAQAYADGAPTKDLRDALDAKARDVELAVDALRGLDKRLVDVSRKENAEARATMRKEASRDYERALKSMEKSTKALVTDAQKHVGDAEVLEVRVRKAIADATWEAVNERFSDAYTERVPAIVSGVPSRDDDGVRINTSSMFAARR